MKRPALDRPDPELDALLADASASIDRELRQAPVPWDFAAVLARAHELDPVQISAEDVHEAGLAAPVVSLAHERRRRPTHDDPAFERLVADVRADAEHDAALRMHGVVALPPRPAAAWPLRGMLLGALALAAVLVLGFGLLEGVRYVQRDRRGPPDAALHQGEVTQPTYERADIDDGGEPAERPRPRVEPELAPAPLEPAPLETIVPSALPAAASKVVFSKPKAKAVGAAPLPSLAERIAVIDAEAHAAWKARDFALAEQRFEALIELAGGSRLADLAYGDLFTLARRSGERSREPALWKRYLARFPDGRFADDARAGLCRRAATDARAVCWRDYLDDFPGGSYRAQAQRESDDEG
jgi:hypothetical protein